MKETTPLLDQYLDIKRNYPDAILLFRMGDFYETFYDDAKLVSEILSITLTSREYASKDVPLAGFPIKAADQYISRLVKTNRKVAVCEQLEEPAGGAKLVRRGVVEVITPGTIMRESLLNDKENNYIGALKAGEDGVSLAVSDISTGEMYAVEFGDAASAGDYVMKLSMSEILSEREESGLPKEKTRVIGKSYFEAKEARRILEEHFGSELAGTGFLTASSASLSAAGALIAYLQESQNRSLSQIRSISVKSALGRMNVDYQTMRNLEIFERMNGEKKNSFIDVIDKSKTAMGGRLLRRILRSPFCSAGEINEKLSYAEKFASDKGMADEAAKFLSRLGDTERINSRIASARAVPRDLILLSSAVRELPSLRRILSGLSLEGMLSPHEELEGLCGLIENALDRERVLSGEKERYFKRGYDADYDELLSLSTGTSERIFRMEEEERRKTGIQNLRIGYNSVMGYYIEVTNSNKERVPEEYIRKQTLKNAERFINAELKELEEKILSAEEKLNSMEREMFASLVSEASKKCGAISLLSDELAETDIACMNGRNAFENDWTKPVVGDFDEIFIEDGRHPVVESVDRTSPFTPNSLSMDKSVRVILLTGPNMSGKSTYLRQNAIIIFMSHAGMFVPAKSARIPVTDRIFTRIGASDDISRGVSTFMAEMLESANIINNMTKRSFIVLDEIGRGTSTFDGLALAWAILEYIHDSPLSPKTLFATHYHELTELSSKLPKLRNRTTKVRKLPDRIIFLRKVVDGSTDESYGVEVAKMAGLPAEITENAMKILKLLKESELDVKEKMRDVSQMKLFAEEKNSVRESASEEVMKRLSRTDVGNTTPMEALMILGELKKISEEEGGEKK